MCTSRSEREAEASTALHYAMLVTSLHKIIARGKHAFPNSSAVFQAAHIFFATALIGTLRAEKEEREKLLPGGIGLSEATAAYSYIRAVWKSDTFGMDRRPKTIEQMDADLRSYLDGVRLLDDAISETVFTIAEQKTLAKLQNFCICAQSILTEIASSKIFELRNEF